MLEWYFAKRVPIGVPSISHKTGGVPSLVEDKNTGMLFNTDSGYEEIVDNIINIKDDPKKYIELSKKSYEKYKTELNWKVITNKIIMNMI